MAKQLRLSDLKPGDVFALATGAVCVFNRQFTTALKFSSGPGLVLKYVYIGENNITVETYNDYLVYDVIRAK